MSAWVFGLGAAAIYLFNKNTQVVSRLEQAVDDFYDAASPATDGATTAEIRQTKKMTDHVTYGDMNAAAPKERQFELEARRAEKAAEVERFDAQGSMPTIQGVMMQFDRSGF
tara:strand:- start:1752 stop:2087 length:336 start_codon:yes stop_codon:yes gene_type:complete